MMLRRLFLYGGGCNEWLVLFTSVYFTIVFEVALSLNTYYYVCRNLQGTVKFGGVGTDLCATFLNCSVRLALQTGMGVV